MKVFNEYICDFHNQVNAKMGELTVMEPLRMLMEIFIKDNG